MFNPLTQGYHLLIKSSLMLGPFLSQTELLFDVVMGHRRAFAYQFAERLYQYVIGCYSITSDKPFFCRVNRSKHSGAHVRLFVLPVCQSNYTSIELTPKKPCAFFTTPAWVVVMTDTDKFEYTGKLDPYNGATLMIESQGIVESNRVSLDETLSWFSSFDFVSPSALAQFLPEIIDERFSPSDRLLMPVANRLKNQVLTPSINIVRMLLSLVPETHEPAEEVPRSLRERLTSVQASLRHSSSMKAKVEEAAKAKALPPPPSFSSSLDHCTTPDHDQTLETIEELIERESVGSMSPALSSVAPSFAGSNTKTEAKHLFLAWTRAAKVLVLGETEAFTLQNLMLLTYKFWSKHVTLPPLKTLKPGMLLFSLLAQLNTSLKDDLVTGHAVNDLVLEVLNDAKLKAETSLMELLVVLCQEVIDIERVLPSDIQPYIEGQDSALILKNLNGLVKTPLRPVASLMEEMGSLDRTTDLTEDL